MPRIGREARYVHFRQRPTRYEESSNSFGDKLLSRIPYLNEGDGNKGGRRDREAYPQMYENPKMTEDTSSAD